MTINLSQVVEPLEDKVLDLIDLARAAEKNAIASEDQRALGTVADHLTAILAITRGIINPNWFSNDDGESKRLAAREARRAARKAQAGSD
jgi:hypothetical protein